MSRMVDRGMLIKDSDPKAATKMWEVVENIKDILTPLEGIVDFRD